MFNRGYTMFQHKQRAVPWVRMGGDLNTVFIGHLYHRRDFIVKKHRRTVLVGTEFTATAGGIYFYPIGPLADQLAGCPATAFRAVTFQTTVLCPNPDDLPRGKNPGAVNLTLTNFLAQLEYNIGEDTFPDNFDLGFLDMFNVIVFTDIGWVGDAGSETNLFGGFDGLSVSNIKNDIGIALANRDGSVRLEIARRTDTGRKPFNILFRINKAF